MGNFGFQELLLIAVIGTWVLCVILFCNTLQKTLAAIAPENRAISPGSVWLVLIPIFGFVWSFIMVNAIANSCKLQLEQYGVFYDQKPAYSIGIAWAVCWVLSIVVGLFSVPAFVLLIVYWIKVNEIKKQLLSLKLLYENKEDGSIL